jgi:hypothetical protein
MADRVAGLPADAIDVFGIDVAGVSTEDGADVVGAVPGFSGVRLRGPGAVAYS